MIIKPYKRTFRPNKKDCSSAYHRDSRFAKDGQRYIDAFKIIQKDLLTLFDYVYPSDANKATYSMRIQDIYVRSCIEVEANLIAILSENGYHKQNFKMIDFQKVDSTHLLSQYKVDVPHWDGENKTILPFSAWAQGAPLKWYQSYNKLKHEKYQYFDHANLLNAVTAVCANIVLLSSQFNIFELNSIWHIYSGGDNPKKLGIGGYFHITFPITPLELMYDFDWSTIKSEMEPFSRLDFEK